MANVVRVRSSRASGAAFAVVVCLAVGAPGSAVAQQTAQKLPDPNDGRGGAQRADRTGGSGLPNTGVFAAPLLTAALALLGAGMATAPARRRRRAYRCDTWWDEVSAGRRRAGTGT